MNHFSLDGPGTNCYAEGFLQGFQAMDMVWNWGGAGLLGDGNEAARSGSENEAKRRGIGRVWQGIQRVWKITGMV